MIHREQLESRYRVKVPIGILAHGEVYRGSITLIRHLVDGSNTRISS